MTGAIISSCGQYRYRLERRMSDYPTVSHDAMVDAGVAGKTVAFFGVNPSRADAFVDDATVRKWVGFCLRWGVPRFIVGNVFAYRATDVRDLGREINPIGADNHWHLGNIAAAADILVPCWGDVGKVPDRLRENFMGARSMLATYKKPIKVFGLTATGCPRHPLMLGYDTPLIDWRG